MIRSAAVTLAVVLFAWPPQPGPPVIVGAITEYHVSRGDTWTSVGPD